MIKNELMGEWTVNRTHKLILSFLVGSLILMTTFQNCSPQVFKGRSDVEEDRYNALSASDKDLLKVAETNLQRADLNVYKFLAILEQLEKMTQLQGSADKITFSDNATPDDNLKRLQFTSNVFGSIFGFLNAIPPVTAEARIYLSAALSNLRQLQKPHPDDMILKSLVLLVEIKTQLIEEMTFLQKNPHLSNSEKSEHINSFLNNLTNLLTELLQALIFAKPSVAQNLEQFLDGFFLILQMILEIQKGTFMLPPGALPPDVQLENILFMIAGSAGA